MPWGKRPITDNFGWLYWIGLLLSSGLFGILYYIAVPVVDDLWFSMPLDSQEMVSQRFMDAISLTSDRWQTDMLRLPNQMVAVLLMVCPRWSVGIFVTLLCMGAIEGGRRIIGSGVADWTTYAWLFCFWICLPWYDYMLSLSYILNYVLPSALALWTLYFFHTAGKSDAPAWGRGKQLYILVLSFFTGWAHECFAVPLAAGMSISVLSCLRSRHSIPKKRLGMFVSLCLGILVICFSPILGARASEGGDKVSGMPLWEMMIQLGPSVLAVSAALIAGIAGMTRCKKPHMTILTMLIPMCLVAELIAFIFYNGPRTTWAAVIYSMVSVFVMLQTVRSHSRATVALAVITLAAVSFHLGSSIQAQTELSKEINEVTEKYNTSLTGEVYYDVTTPHIDATLLKTTVRVLNERIPLKFIEMSRNEYNADRRPKELSILPTRLVDFPGLQFSSQFEGQRMDVYRNLVVADTVYEDALKSRVPLILVDENGNETESRYRISSFHAKNGKRHIALFPHAQTLDSTFRIKSSRLIL